MTTLKSGIKLQRQTMKANAPKISLKKKPAKVKPDALGVEYTGNGEADSRNEIEAVKGEFQKRREQEQARFVNATDSEFWVAVCFENREQKDEFLRKSGLAKLGDKYIDGTKAAELLEIELTAKSPPIKPLKNHRGRFGNLIREV